jgi:hypothetical protein
MPHRQGRMPHRQGRIHKIRGHIHEIRGHIHQNPGHIHQNPGHIHEIRGHIHESPGKPRPAPRRSPPPPLPAGKFRPIAPFHAREADSPRPKRAYARRSRGGVESYPGAARASRCEHDNDLHACAESRGARGAESARRGAESATRRRQWGAERRQWWWGENVGQIGQGAPVFGRSVRRFRGSWERPG